MSHNLILLPSLFIHPNHFSHLLPTIRTTPKKHMLAQEIMLWKLFDYCMNFLPLSIVFPPDKALNKRRLHQPFFSHRFLPSSAFKIAVDECKLNELLLHGQTAINGKLRPFISSSVALFNWPEWITKSFLGFLEFFFKEIALQKPLTTKSTFHSPV